MVITVFPMTMLLTGCGNGTVEQKSTQTEAQTTQAATTNSTAIDTSKEMKLIMYLVGDKQPDADLVYEEVNKKLKTDINTTVELKYLSWADYTTKYNLIFASGEDFDCIYTGNWVGYAQQAVKNGFLKIEKEMVQKYAPDYFAVVPAEAWDQVKINGSMYMLPYLHQQMGSHWLVNYRGDMAEKYKLGEINSIESLDNYLFAIAKNEKGLKAFDGNIKNLMDFMTRVFYNQPANLASFSLDPDLFYYKMDDNSGKVINAIEDPAYLEMLKKAKTYADAGVWAKEILAQKNTNDDNYKSGKSSIATTHIEQTMANYADLMAHHPDWKPQYADLQPDKIHFSSSASNGGIGIHATSKNADRVMMMINLFATKKDYYDLTTYGIEGKHYTAVGDNKLKSTEEGLKNFPPKSNCPWGWERTDFIRYSDTLPDSLINTEKTWMAKGLASKSPLSAFNFVDTNVKNEIAACGNIFKTRGYILLAGLSKNPEEDLKILGDDLKKAGIEKVQQELQTQVDAFLQSIE
jgi:ABC-type sugar transport system, periplasmic component